MQRCLGCMREFGEKYDVCPHCGYIVGSPAASKNHLAPGTMLQGRYLLGKVLGQGGFGITYIAWDNKIGRPVAIKEYMPSALASRMTGEKEVSCYNEEARRQFDLGLERTRQETHALSQFNALESVVKVHDCIEENGTAYIIMELLRGKTVKEILAARGRLTFAETMRIMTPILQTLDAMHGVGMIHRDVAPDNIFVCDDGKIKLLDFGAARVINNTDEKTLSVTLKAGYAPAEQYSSKGKQGPYTDVYAASATMYKMLTGETPPDSFSREKNNSDLAALAQTDVPQSVQATILRGMAPDVPGRIKNTKELLETLQKDAPDNIEGIDPKLFLQEQKKQQTKKIVCVVLSAVLIVLAAGIVIFFCRGARRKTEAPTAAFADTETTSESSQTETIEAEDIAEAISIEPQNQNGWVEAYRQYLNTLCENPDNFKEGDNSYFGDQLPGFYLCNINQDSAPELIVFIPAISKHIIVTYDVNGIHPTEFQRWDDNGHESFSYNKENEVLIMETRQMALWDNIIYQLQNGVYSEIWAGTVTGGMPGIDYSYSIGEEEVSESEYQAAYKRFVPDKRTYLYTGYKTLNSDTIELNTNNIQVYFDALLSPESIPELHTRPLEQLNTMTLQGTVFSAELYNMTEKEYSDVYGLLLDAPLVASVYYTEYPILIASVRLDYPDESVTSKVGKTVTLTGQLSGEENDQYGGCIDIST